MKRSEELKNIVDYSLKKYFDDEISCKTYDKTLWKSMAYTTLLGGKRLRAVMCLEACAVFCNDYSRAIPMACAIEMLHAQSLIHDDLPCMDNDDLRRGKPSNHKIFGEAMAVLAGDALITYGAEVILDKTPSEIDKNIILKNIKDYFDTAGAKGIVAGQCADMEAENLKEKITPQHLRYIHQFKTASMFILALVCGARIGGANEKQLESMKKIGENFGLAFQIYDDILDVISTTDELGKTAGKDQKSNKATYVTLYGLNKAKDKFKELICETYDILSNEKIASCVFKDIANSMLERVKR